uniref:Glycosyl transferase, family 4 n=1 Tax=Thermofilum pendens TaxID=2269 RepID=A0A7C4FDD1_THEPE
MYAALLAAATSFIVTKLSAPVLINLLRSKGVVRPDAHKPGNPQVAHAGGVVIFLGTTAGFATWFALTFALTGVDDTVVRASVALLAGAVCFLVGLVDDLRVLGGLTKTVATVLSIFPITAVALLRPDLIEWGRPSLPFIGTLRITIIYWALLPLAVAGPANVVNMLDVLNGVIPGMMLTAYSMLALIAALTGGHATLALSLIVVGVLLAYYPYNAYPARVFNGDSGSLFLGGLLGALAVIEHYEFVVFTLLLPHLLNGFMILVSFRGFKEHRKVPKRPTYVDDQGMLHPSRDVDAPLTLTRLALLLGGSATEREVARLYFLLELSACALALLSVLH